MASRRSLFQTLHRGVLYTAQFLTAIYSVPVRFLIMRIHVHRPPALRIPRGTLILSNHQSRSDPFILVNIIGVYNSIHTLPVYFPTVSSFMRMPILGWGLRLLNCYDIGSTLWERARGLLYTRELLRRKETVVLFPEGQIMKEGNHVRAFNKGLDIILRDDVPLVLVRLRGFNDWSRRSSAHISDVLSDLSYEEKRERIRSFYDGE